VKLRPDPGDWTPGSGLDLQRPEFTRRVLLADGGVYDNLGLETAWKRYQTILVSDGGGHIGGQANVKTDWIRQALRVLGVIDSQVRALRKRQAVGGFVGGEREGAYWGIRSRIADYGLDDPLEFPHEVTHVKTRLARVDDAKQELLVDWGYVICDTAMRRHVVPGAPRPAHLPYA
jgi:NTE family protein